MTQKLDERCTITNLDFRITHERLRTPYSGRKLWGMFTVDPYIVVDEVSSCVFGTSNESKFIIPMFVYKSDLTPVSEEPWCFSNTFMTWTSKFISSWLYMLSLSGCYLQNSLLVVYIRKIDADYVPVIWIILLRACRYLGSVRFGGWKRARNKRYCNCILCPVSEMLKVSYMTNLQWTPIQCQHVQSLQILAYENEYTSVSQ